MSEPATPVVNSAEDLVAWFRGAEKPASQWRVGTEHEKIGVYAANGERVPYEGERGIRVLLQRIAARDGWTPVLEHGHVIALEKDAASITLEPGGQLELSGAPLSSIWETCREFNAHVELVKQVSEDLGIVWLSLGADPFHKVSEIPIMPKGRYAIMREYLPKRGSLGLEMMHSTATVQANFDYSSERDMASKMRTAMGCTPIVSAIFANSSLTEGRDNGLASRRVAIWRDTDPDRCGLLHFVFDPDFGYRDYVEWALDVPMFFIVRDGRYVQVGNIPFRTFMREGFGSERACEADWEAHLRTVFPEIRLKKVIEVRGADAVPCGLTCALPALWKGILYDDAAREAAWQLVRSFTWEQREAAQIEVARLGLAGTIAGRPVLGLARELTEIAREGLRRIAARGVTDADESGFLDPVHAQLELGQSPGEEIRRRWNGEWQGSMQRLIDHARY